MRCLTATTFPTMSGSTMTGSAMPETRHYSWHSGMNTADNAVFAVFAAAAAKGAKPVAAVNKKRSPQRLGEALR